MVKVLFYKTTVKFYHISYQFLRCCNDKYWYKSCFVPKKQKILMLRKFCYEVIYFSGLFVLLPKLRIMSLLLE